MTDAVKVMEGHLRAIDNYHQSIQHHGLESCLLAKGIWFQGRANSNDYPTCKEWKRKKQPKIQDCYYNAQSFCTLHDEAARYFEGYALIDPKLVPVEHAWIVMADGKVVDFTFEALEREAKRQKLPRDTSKCLYVGLEVPLDVVTLSVLKRKAYGPVAEEFLLSQKAGEPKKVRRRHTNTENA